MKIKPCLLFRDVLNFTLKTGLGMLLASMTLQAQPAAPGAGRQLAGHVPEAVAHLTSTGRLPLTNELRLAICLPLRNQETLTNLLEQIYNPASPNYHHYLTPEEFTEKFGPTEADYQAVIGFAQASGLAVAGTHPNRTLLDVTGTVADIEKAFHVTLRVYPHPKEARLFYAPDVEPTVNLAVPLLHIGGLDNYELPHPLFKMRSAQKQGQVAAYGSGPDGTYMGIDFRNAYVPGVTLNGAGQTVALFEMDGYYSSDITYYEATNGLPNVGLTNVLLGRFAGLPVNGAEVEVCLDIEMAISMAPNLSQVMVYEAPLTSVGAYDILNQIATDNRAKQISSSWVIDRIVTTPVPNEIYLQFAAQGQSFFQASGDEDAYTPGTYQTADNPYITTVGGTTLTTTGPGGFYVSETVWQWGDGSGSGGGISTNFAIPTYQQGINMTTNLGSTTMRNVPDVALTADNVYVRAGGEDNDGVGGTSCAAPLWAGFMALVNQQAAASGRPPVGFVNPAIYAIGAGVNYTSLFHDITKGNNTNSLSPTKFYAVPGYDLCTGWGTPAGLGLINALANPDALSIIPQTGFASSGGVGGPFTIISQSLILTNTGTSTLAWSLVNTSAWLTVFPSNGTLTPGGASATVTASLNLAASNLLVGAYATTVLFSNLNSNVGQSRQFTLSIISPPAITLQPANQSVQDGSSATFTVGVTGGQPLSFQWQANSNNLTDGTHISGSATNTLIIKNVSPADVASYCVVVTNAAGTMVSSNALLSALPGNVDHFSWSTISSPQVFVAPFPASITALDTVNVVATNFNGTVGITGGGAQTLYQFNFESGLQGFVIDNTVGSGNGLWHLSSGRAYDPGHSPTNSLYYGHGEGLNGGGNYDNGLPNGGVVISPALNLPLGLTAITLSFNYLMYVESVTDFDVAYVEISTNNGVSYQEVASKNSFGGLTNYTYGLWVSNNIDISAFAGQTIKLRFRFDTIDAIDNDTEGWYVDDVAIRSASVPATVMPASAGPFTNGIWSGNLAVLQVTTNAVLAASDGAGHFGTSNPFNVIYSNQPPIIVLQPTNQILPAGFNATFTLAAAGSPTLSYFWLRNSGLIPGATNSNYTATNIQLTDSGSQFSCVVSNTYGITNSQTATLTVVALPPSISQQPANLTAPIGSTASFGLIATGSLPLNYTWLRNGMTIANATNSNYVTNNIQMTDSGSQFSCLVSNAYGAILSSNATLTVVTQVIDLITFDDLPNTTLGLQVPPGYYGLTWSNFYEMNGIASPGGGYSNAVVSASNVIYNAYGSPASIVGTNTFSFISAYMTAAWIQGLQVTAKGYANGVLLYNQTFMLNTNGPAFVTFNFIGITEVDFSDSADSQFAMDNVQVSSSPTAPTIQQQPISQTVSIGGTASFSVTAAGTSPLNYVWMRNGGAIPGATNATYATNNVQLADSGSQFSCLVSNAYGTVLSSSATLTVTTITLPVFLAGNYLYLPIQTNGVFLAANTGAKYNSSGTGGATGVDYWEPGVPVYNYIVGVGGINYLNGSAPVVQGFVSVTVSNLSSGSLQHALISGVVIPGLNFTRDISFATNSKVIRLVDTLQNTGATTLTNVVTLDTADPDQDSAAPINPTSATLNDVVSVNFSNDMVIATGPSTGLSVGFGSDSGIQIPSAVGFNNLTAYPYLVVVDPNGALGDIDINLAENYGTLAAGQSHSVVWYTIFGSSKMEVTNAFATLGSNAPVITSQPADVTVSIGNNATFTVGASGAAPLSYFWSRNGSTIPGANASSYTLTNAQIADSGSQFSCLITNGLGAATSAAAVLKVDTTVANDQCSGAIIISGLTYTNAQYTTNATSIGDPVPDCISDFGNGVWYQYTPAFGGQLEVDTFGSDFDTGLALYTGSCGAMTEVACNDDTGGLQSQIIIPVSAGTPYFILAGGYSGYTGHLLIHLALTAPPVIVAQPTNENVTVGSMAVFSVGASGSTPMNYLWMRNATSIPNATNSIYAITNVQLTDSGSQFSCVVTNSCGTTNSATATLTVTVDHFAWGAIGSPQLVNSPFASTITAQDVNNQTVTNFTGTLALSTEGGGGTTTNHLMEGLSPGLSGAGTYTWGYLFTPTNNLVVTHVSSYFGTKVSLWTSNGVLLTAQNVTGPVGAWTETALFSPVPLAAGSNYVVAAYVSGAYYWLTSLSGAFANGAIGNSISTTSDAFPTSTDPGAWPLVGLRYYVNALQALPIIPTNSGPFVSGTWTGNLTVLQVATNVVLLATDGIGHSGLSNPFQVVSNSVITKVTMLPGGSIQITLAGSPGEVYQVLDSTNLLNWQTIATVTNLTGTVQFTDPCATNYNQCFYRLVMP